MSNGPDFFQPVRTSFKYEAVADQLASLIASGKLRSGDTLGPEEELAAQFGVSRSSIREALRHLQAKGLVQSNGGVRTVADTSRPMAEFLDSSLLLGQGTILELLEVRRILEIENAGLAARRATPDDIALMARAVGEMEGGLESSRVYVDADLDFHMAICNATKNSVMTTMVRAIRDVITDALEITYQIPGSAAKSLLQHRLILEAIQRGDAEEARKLMAEHLAKIEKEVREAGAKLPSGSRRRR
ncbi:MAG: FadR family transcriptional regulator [Firmicutes bacterium]|nr:FadR family transcriptional regulator [Bacillota bacterium]